MVNLKQITLVTLAAVLTASCDKPSKNVYVLPDMCNTPNGIMRCDDARIYYPQNNTFINTGVQPLQSASNFHPNVQQPRTPTPRLAAPATRSAKAAPRPAPTQARPALQRAAQPAPRLVVTRIIARSPTVRAGRTR